MKMQIVAIRDKVADAYGQPNFVVSLGSAIRSFGDEIKRPHSEERPNPLNSHPEDFELFNLGTYDDNTAEFEPIFPPKQIALGRDYAVVKK